MRFSRVAVDDDAVLVGEHGGLYSGAQAEFQEDAVDDVRRSARFRRITR